jgi:AraC-like DNA-binding protein
MVERARPCRVPAGLALLLDELGATQINPTQINPARVDPAGSSLTIEGYFTLWESIAAATDDPTLGIRLGARYPEDVLEPALLACLGSRDLGEGLERLARYKRTLSPETLTLRRSNGRVEVHYDWPTARREPPPILVEAELSFLLHLARRATRRKLAGAQVKLTRPAGEARQYAEAFDADVRLGARHGVLSLPATDLALPFATFNAALLAVLDPALQAERYVVEPDGSDAVAATRYVVRRGLGDGETALHRVAAELGVSARTLQRQLQRAGTNFAEVLRDTRRDQAIFYLRRSELSLSEIAYLVGFDSPSSFFRAFGRWTGMTPRAYRDA